MAARRGEVELEPGPVSVSPFDAPAVGERRQQIEAAARGRISRRRLGRYGREPWPCIGDHDPLRIENGVLQGLGGQPLPFQSALFTIADDIVRLRERVIRLKDPNCHAEYPPSRTRRLITNVRITSIDGDTIAIAANFVVYRYRRGELAREFVGRYRHKLRRIGGVLKIAERRAILDAHELGPMGAVSFIL